MSKVAEKTVLNGCEFLIRDSSWDQSFGHEDFSEEQIMILDMMKEFVSKDVIPFNDKLEKQEDNLNERLLKKMGDLGLLGAHMPEAYGGIDLDFNTNSIIGELIGPSGGFSVTYNAHTGIGMLPILYFGTEEQKNKYIPGLISGDKCAAYCLTEPSSGSDALAAKTKAELTPDGKHYVLNGQKMWISNAGFADVFTVFAQVDGDKFTGFILEAGMPGLTLGAEEQKLGIKASSTRQVFLENVKVPVENVLGEIGKGHLIAFNVLNIGRYKLGVSCLGGYKALITESVRYANERHQFQVPISSFGAIKHKLGEQAIRAFTSDSATYRVSNLINDRINEYKESGCAYAESKLKAAEEYALECSIIKIVGSEDLDYIVDEALQIHGGMGFSEESKVAQAYRDARINRIFEGTNEINRMLIVNTLMKRAMKGKIDLMTPVLAIQQELMSGSPTKFEEEAGDYAQERFSLSQFKKCLLIVLGAAAQKAMSGSLDMKTEQELLTNLADIIIRLFSAESLLMRVEKLSKNAGKEISQEVYDAMLKTYFHDTRFEINKCAIEAIMIFVDENMKGALISSVQKLTKYPYQNVKVLRRKVADALIDKNEYCF